MNQRQKIVLTNTQEAKKWWARLWPVAATGGFTTGGLLQLHTVITRGSVGVSAITWGMYSIILFGWALYYWNFLKRDAKLPAVIMTILNALIYGAIYIAASLY